MRRTALALWIALTALACGGSPPDLPGGDAPEGFERKHYSARLIEAGGRACLKVDGIGDLNRSGPGAGESLRERAVGRWGYGYATEDHPSSFLRDCALELRADGTATYGEEEGSESLGTDGEIRASMHFVKGPWVGMWTVTEDGEIQIEFLVPEVRHP